MGDIQLMFSEPILNQIWDIYYVNITGLKPYVVELFSFRQRAYSQNESKVLFEFD